MTSWVITEMNGEPLTHSKKSWHGQRARLRLLVNAGITIPGDLGDVGSIPPDDIIDSAAAAWSADRIANGKADCLGGPALDAEPNPSAGQIWYSLPVAPIRPTWNPSALIDLLPAVTFAERFCRMRCAKCLMLWCLKKMQKYWWYVEACCKRPERKELVQIASENRSI